MLYGRYQRIVHCGLGLLLSLLLLVGPPAMAQDNNRIADQVAAQSAYEEGEQLRAQRTAESLRKAIEKYESALPFYRAAGDRRREALMLHNIGLVYRNLGEFGKALDYYNQALPLRQVVGDLSDEALTLNNIGVVYESLGETQKALDCYNKALPLYIAASDRRREAYTLNNIGVVYRSLGDNQKALDYHNQALMRLRAVRDPRGEAAALTNIGIVYRYLGENQKALDHQNQALTQLRAAGDRYGEALALHNIGLVYLFSLGEKQKALDYNNQALLLRQAIGDRYGEASTLNNIGLAYASLGEKQKALDYYNQALPLRRAVGDRGGEAATLYCIAKVERDLGNLNGARSRIEDALKIIESLRTKIEITQLRTSYFASVRDYYEVYIDLLMQLHKLKPGAGLDAAALQAGERARARTLLEMLAEARADIRQGIDPKLLERELSLQQLLSSKAEYQRQLLTERNSEVQTQAVQKEIEATVEELQNVEAQIRKDSSNYAALKYPEPLSLSEIQQQLLNDDTLFLEFSLGEERSYLWAVTPTSIASFELPKRAKVEETARRVYELLTARTYTEDEKEQLKNKDRRKVDLALKAHLARVAKADSEYWDATAALSNMVLGPAAELLGRKRLVIVSEGVLQYIPFAALPPPQSKGLASKTPLVVEHEFINLPSATTLAVVRRELSNRIPAQKMVAVFADPIFSKSDKRVINHQPGKDEGEATAMTPAIIDAETAAREFGIRGDFEPLVYSRFEAKAISSLVQAGGCKLALDFEASRATAMSPELTSYRIIHFATHGLLNSEHPALSGLVLSMVDVNSNPQDGFLRLQDIYNLNLPADLVVLSACKTGLGKDIKGEGLVGLTRGFMYAGAARVMSSLWTVSDKATSELMRNFYKAMLEENGMSPAAALHDAQIKMWRKEKGKLSHPYYWAGFILQGDWRE
jgi:CHAT domain-containing protein/tetratricopeptide (TPR) repeat protein